MYRQIEKVFILIKNEMLKKKRKKKERHPYMLVIFCYFVTYNPPMVVDIFIPCTIDQYLPDTAFNMIKILERIDVSVNYNPNQTCCGLHAFNCGFWDETKEIGEKFINEFMNSQYIVVPSTKCATMVKNYYSELFHNTAFHNEYKTIQKNIFELTDFLVTVMNVTNLGSTFNGVVTYHDSCSALREYKLVDQPRILLNNVKGLELREMSDCEMCCGYGESFSVTNEPISASLAYQKVQNAQNTGANFITSSEPTCLMHLDAYIKKNNLSIKPIHLIDILASGL